MPEPRQFYGMGRLSRRRMLKTTGAGAVLGAASTASAGQQRTQEDDPEPAEVTNADWTMWRFNRSNTGRNPLASVSLEEPDTWAYTEATDETLYSPAVADGTAYFGAFDQKMHAVNARTGEQEWTSEAGGILQSTPTILNGTVYSAAYDGEIYAWDAETGDEVWNVVGGGAGERTTSVTVNNSQDAIFVGSDDSVFRLVPETGEIEWEYTTEDNLTGSPSLASGVTYVGDWSGYLYAINTATGEEVWKRRLGSDIRSTAAIVDGVLYIGVFASGGASGAQFDGSPTHRRDDLAAPTPVLGGQSATLPTGVYALDAATGEINWQHEMARSVFCSPAVSEGLVFAADYSGELVALDIETGDVVWTHQFEGEVTSSPAYNDGQLYIGGSPEESSVFVFDAGTGAVLNELPVGDNNPRSPAVTDDGIFVVSDIDEESSVLDGFVSDVSERGLAGTVFGPDGEPQPGTQLYLFTRTQEWQAIGLIELYPDLFPPDPAEVLDPEAQSTAGGNGGYSLTGAETGVYHVLAVPPEDSGHGITVLENVPVGEEVRQRDVTVPDRQPLAELETAVEELFEQGRERLDSVTDEAASVFIDGVDRVAGTDPESYLMDGLEVTDSALSSDLDMSDDQFEQELKQEVTASALDVAEHGLGLALEHLWGSLEPELQATLTEGSSALLDADWFRNFEYLDPDLLVTEGYSLLPVYTEADEAITSAGDQFDGFVGVEPAEEFSIAAAKSALQDVEKQLRKPEYGVPGTVVLPNGDTFSVDQTETYASDYEWTGDRIEDIGQTKLLAQTAKVAGGALVLTGKAAPIGVKLFHAGEAVQKKAELAETIAKTKLAIEWGLTQVHWTVDVEQIGGAVGGTVDWLEGQIDEQLRETELQITSVDLSLSESQIPGHPPFVSANRPVDAPGWFPLAVQWKAVKEATIEITNNDDSAVPVRVTMYDQYDGGENVSNEGAMSPPVEEEPETIPANSTETFTLEYAADYGGLLGVHDMITHVWVNGTIAAEDDTLFEVRPGIAIGGGDSDPGTYRTDQFVVTTEAHGHNRPMTERDLDEFRPQVERLLGDSEVTPEEPLVETTYTTGEDAARLSVLLSTTGTVALRVFDEQGRTVGFDPSVDKVRNQIDGARYVGPDATPQIVSLPTTQETTYTIQATGYRFVTSATAEVDVQTVETPQREAILSVSPGAATATITPGETDSVELSVSEVGEQVAIENAEIVPGTFTDSNGNELQGVTVAPEESSFEVTPGGKASVAVTFDADEEIPVPGAPEETVFEGTLSVQTANAGTVSVSVSALVLSTDIIGARLVSASREIEGVTLTETDTDQFADGRPPEVQLSEAFDLSVTGSGGITLAVPEPSETKQVHAYAVGEEWTKLETGRVDGEMRVGVETPVTGDALVVGVGPAAITNGQLPKDFDGDGLYHDVNGDGTLDLRDARSLLVNIDSEAVQLTPEYFDFSGDGEAVTLEDVRVLFRDIVEQNPAILEGLDIDDPATLSADELRVILG